MNVILWLLTGLLAAMFLAAGAGKLAQSKEKLAASPNMAWAEDFSPEMLKLIGTLEVLAAVGLILPAALDVAPIIVPLAAVGPGAADDRRRHHPRKTWRDQEHHHQRRAPRDGRRRGLGTLPPLPLHLSRRLRPTQKPAD